MIARAIEYFRAENPEVKLRNSTPEIREYNMKCFFWEKFGIPEYDLDRYDINWIRAMLDVAEADGIVFKEKFGKK